MGIDTIKYLNSFIKQKDNFKYKGPASLFKYRPFDEYTFDMLENNYLYLCPAGNEDDETECDVTLDFYKLMDLETNNLKRECVNQIIQMIRPYSSSENFGQVEDMMNRITNPNGTIRPNYMMEVVPKLQELVPGINVAPFVNWIIEIPERLDDPLIKPLIEQFLTMGLNAKKGMGICSLSESSEIAKMWEEYYAGYDTGYCIEYDVSNYSLNDVILPVVYDDERNTNIIMQIVNVFICQKITDFSYGQIDTDITQYIRLFLTKNKKWKYQREWRLIGEVGEKPKAPKIKTIFLGKKVSEENKKKMFEYCKKMNIKLVERI